RPVRAGLVVHRPHRRRDHRAARRRRLHRPHPRLNRPPMTLPAERTEPAAPFTARHIGPSTAEQQQMLQLLGYPDLDALMADAIPGQILDETAPVLPEPAGEAPVRSRPGSARGWRD